MKISGTTKIIRDYVANNLPNTISPTALMLLASADTIDRLIKERDEALELVRELLEVRDKDGETCV